MPRPPAHLLRRKPPFFHPVPLRARRDGWSVARQCQLLAQLYLTGSVTKAARDVGMSRASGYRLRERVGAESFAHAWDSIFVPPGMEHPATPEIDWRKVTNPTLIWWIERGLVRPEIWRGRMTGIRQKPDNSALLRLLHRHDAALRARGAEGMER